ncbi:hypothetical protein [Saccharothrix coeruleofusca]|nr:hypothetical protein [Saccharothrix coeruleofusca]MBP2333921.1 hypothetical protein [Saccharothrix coeruleofusca]
MWLDDLGVVGASTWCLTLVRDLWAEEVLELAGAPVVRDGSLADAERVNMIAVRPVGAAWSLAVEFNGWLGFVGNQDDLLVELSANGATACSAWSTPNNEGVVYVPAPDSVVRYHPSRRQLDGPISPAMLARMTDTGILADADDGTSLGDRMVTAISVFTGIFLDQEFLVADDWVVGVGHPDRVREAIRRSGPGSRTGSRWPDAADLRMGEQF